MINFIKKACSYMLDTAIVLLGTSFIGLGVVLFNNDRKVGKNENKG